jgi:cellobiose phosphorylase
VQYAITVKNPKGISKGIKQIVVDGKIISGDHLPLAAKGSKLVVEVELG